MSVSSEVAIMNSALTKLGAELIISPDENNARARTCKLRYPVIRDLMIRSHPWNFAVGYEELAQVSPKPADVFDYDYVFQIPASFLRVVSVSLGTSEDWEEITGRRIACNQPALAVKGIKLITDVTKYDANFVEALAYALAKDMCYTITQSAAQVKQLGDDAKDALRTARSFDAQVGSPKQVIADTWFNQRRY